MTLRLWLFIFGFVAICVSGFLYVVHPTRRVSYASAPVSIRPWLLAAGLLGAFLFVTSLFVAVPSRAAGVKLTFGKVSGSVAPGLHLVEPWSQVRTFPATVNTLRLFGNASGSQEDGPCVGVRLANQQTACVNVQVQWAVDTSNDEAVRALYIRWRTFANIEPGLINPQIQHALLAPFEKYDPLAVLKADGTLNTPTAEFEREARNTLIAAMGNGITIQSLTINLVQYDQSTQDKLNSYAQAIADTRIAQQREQTSAATARANQALAANAASQNQAVLYQNCLDMTDRLAKEGKPLPPAWNCGSPPQSVLNVR